MNYYSGFDESYLYAYQKGAELFRRARTPDIVRLSDCAATKRDIETLNLEALGVEVPNPSVPGCIRPTDASSASHHMLVANNGNRHRCVGVSRHGWSSRIPAGSFVQIAPDVFVSSPEFTFLQLATTMSTAELALAGCTLCSSFCIERATGAIVRREPVTSVERIGTFLDQCSGIRGINAARKGLRYVANGAESPQEINLYLLLSLPPELGGAGIEGLRFNYLVEAKANEAACLDRSDRKAFRIDLGVPELHKGVEYQGKQHEGTVDADRERQNALLALGEQVLQVKYADLVDPAKCRRLVAQVSRLLGVESPKLTPAQKVARDELVDLLFGPARPWM